MPRPVAHVRALGPIFSVARCSSNFRAKALQITTNPPTTMPAPMTITSARPKGSASSRAVAPCCCWVLDDVDRPIRTRIVLTQRPAYTNPITNAPSRCAHSLASDSAPFDDHRRRPRTTANRHMPRSPQPRRSAARPQMAWRRPPRGTVLIGALGRAANGNLGRDDGDDQVGETASGEPSRAITSTARLSSVACAIADPSVASDAPRGRSDTDRLRCMSRA